MSMSRVGCTRFVRRDTRKPRSDMRREQPDFASTRTAPATVASQARLFSRLSFFPDSATGIPYAR